MAEQHNKRATESLRSSHRMPLVIMTELEHVNFNFIQRVSPYLLTEGSGLIPLLIEDRFLGMDTQKHRSLSLPHLDNSPHWVETQSSNDTDAAFKCNLCFNHVKFRLSQHNRIG